MRRPGESGIGVWINCRGSPVRLYFFVWLGGLGEVGSAWYIRAFSAGGVCVRRPEQVAFPFAEPRLAASLSPSPLARRSLAPRLRRAVVPSDPEMARKVLEQRIAQHVPEGRLALA